jgi:diguanylate cyclase (GGDEF)-like protein
VVANVREADVIARYGGEEFVVAVANGDVTTTRHVAEKLRSVTERLLLEVRPGPLARLTISCGVASTELHGSERIPLMRTADRALYRAKEHGRNRVEVAQAHEQTVVKTVARPGDQEEAGAFGGIRTSCFVHWKP